MINEDVLRKRYFVELMHEETEEISGGTNLLIKLIEKGGLLDAFIEFGKGFIDGFKAGAGLK